MVIDVNVNKYKRKRVYHINSELTIMEHKTDGFH